MRRCKYLGFEIDGGKNREVGEDVVTDVSGEVGKRVLDYRTDEEVGVPGNL